MASKKLGTSLVRHFSSSAARNAVVRPPVKVYGIEGAYASALYSAAFKEKKLDVVEKDLIKLSEVYSTDIRFKDFVSDPTANKADKIAAIATASQKLGLSNLTQNLCGTLIDNGRMDFLSLVSRSFCEIMSASRGELYCTVTTAKTLDASNEKQVRAALAAFAVKGQNLFVELKVDSSLIGGMRVSIGDKFVDMSIASKLKLYSDILKTSA